MKKNDFLYLIKNSKSILPLLVVLIFVFMASIAAYSETSTSYYSPVYNDPSDPTSGILEWKNESITEFKVMYGTDKVLTSGWYVIRGNISTYSTVTCTGDVNIILVDESTAYFADGLKVEGSNSLTIYGQSSDSEKMGKLTVTGKGIGGNGGVITINGGNITCESEDSAGIGGYDGNNSGKITINGGKISATSKNGAGIGGGENGNGTNITINGGDIYAKSTDGAGIGGGENGTGSYITINGGTIEAISEDYGAGIGGGRKKSGNNITINGGEVKATGGEGYSFIEDGGSGIGGGCDGEGYLITINGGDVTAKGRDCAAGIGGGEEASGHDITINGGTVEASGDNGGAGIGGGEYRTGYNIYINGGGVTAKGGKNAAGIGGGTSGDGHTGDAENIIITGGSISAYGKKGGAAIGGGNEGTLKSIKISGGYIYATSYGEDGGAGIGGGKSGGCDSVYISGGDINSYGGTDASGIGGGKEGSFGEITISGGTVYAYGGNESGALGVGKDGNTSSGKVTITGGDLTLKVSGSTGVVSGSNVYISTFLVIRKTYGDAVTYFRGNGLKGSIASKIQYAKELKIYPLTGDIGSVFSYPSTWLIVGGAVIIMIAVGTLIFIRIQKKKKIEAET